MTQELDRLWSEARAGDAEQFAVLYRYFRDRVYRHAYSILGQQHDSEDATAITFAELWKRRNSVRTTADGSVLPWLIVTCTNVCRNLRRATRRHAAFLQRVDELATESVASAEQEAVGQLAAQVNSSLIAAAVEKLPAKEAQVVLLVLGQELPITDAARVLGIPDATARTRLRRAKQRLRVHLTSEGLTHVDSAV